MAKRFEKAKYYNKKYGHLLAKCKYCGNAALIVSDRDMYFGQGKGNVWSVVCSTPCCDCTSTDSSVKRVINRWNSRHNTNNLE